MIRSALLAAQVEVRHAHSTRREGSVSPADAAGARGVRDALRREVRGTAGLVVPHQVHGGRVACVGRADAGRGHGGGPAVPGTDGLVTAEPGLALMVQGADCPLLLLVDPEVPALAVVHSGWRGTTTRIAQGGVAALRELGGDPGRVLAAVFPGIGPCCYEVGDEVRAAFGGVFGDAAGAWFTATRPGHALLDLRAAIRATLLDAGVVPAHVDMPAGCTACGGLLWSHRASGGAPQRHGLFAALTT